MIVSDKVEPVKVITLANTNDKIFCRDIWTNIYRNLETEDIGRVSQCCEWFTNFQKIFIREVMKGSPSDMIFSICSGIFGPYDKFDSILEVHIYFKYYIRFYFEQDKFENNLRRVNQFIKNFLLIICDVEINGNLSETVSRNINIARSLLVHDKVGRFYFYFIDRLLICNNYEYKILDRCIELMNDIINEDYDEAVKYLLENLLTRQIVLRKYQQYNLLSIVFLIIENDFDAGLFLVNILLSYKYLYFEIRIELINFLQLRILGKNSECYIEKCRSEIMFYLIKIKQYNNEAFTEFLEKCEVDDYWIFEGIQGFLKNRNDLTGSQQMELFKMIIRIEGSNFNKAGKVIEDILAYRGLNKRVRKKIETFLKKVR